MRTHSLLASIVSYTAVLSSCGATEGTIGDASVRGSDAAASVDRRTMRLQRVRDAVTRNAVCNNGEAFTYWMRSGTGDGAHRWVLFTEGGGACGTIAECTSRFQTEREKMVPGTATELTRQGLFGIDASRNPDFWNWNHVFLNYCSSDGWTGDRAASVATGNFHFRGSQIVRAVVEDLLDSGVTTPPISDATMVVFAGGSAGGQGQLSNLDRVATQLRAARPGLTVVGVTDSFFHPPITDYRAGTTPALLDPSMIPAGTMGASYTLWNAKPNERCVQANAANPHICLNGTIAYRYLETRTFVYEDQFDEERLRRFALLPSDANANPPIVCSMFSLEQRAWLVPYAMMVRESVRTARFGGGFAPAAGFHTALMEDARFVDYRVNGLNYATVLGNWVFERMGPRIVIDDNPCVR